MNWDPNESFRAGGDRRVLAFVSAAAFAVVLGSTMVPVALPDLGKSLSLDRIALSWVVTGYFLVNGVTIPFCGRLADIYGVSRLYGADLATFFLGSVLCALAPSFSVLMAGRLVQGTGAAALRHQNLARDRSLHRPALRRLGRATAGLRPGRILLALTASAEDGWGGPLVLVSARIGAALPLVAGAVTSAVAVVLLSGFGFWGPAWVNSILVTLVGLGATLARIAAWTGYSDAYSSWQYP